MLKRKFYFEVRELASGLLNLLAFRNLKLLSVSVFERHVNEFMNVRK